MNRLLLASTVLLALAAGPPAEAQLRLDKGPAATTIAFGYAFTDSKVTEDPLKAYGLLATFEKFRFKRMWSFGVSLGYIAAADNETINNERADTSYRSFPVYAVWRVYIGQPTGRIALSLGAGVGLGFNRFEWTTSEGNFASFGTSVGATVPIGVLIALTDDFWIRGEYSFHWLNDSFWENDITNMLGVGIVFPS